MSVSAAWAGMPGTWVPGAGHVEMQSWHSPPDCTENSTPGAVRLAQLLIRHISRMEPIQLGGNKNEFMFHSGGSPQEFWNFLQLGLRESG